jgi:hypothetical protein
LYNFLLFNHFFGVYSCILKNKLDKIGLTLIMFEDTRNLKLRSLASSIAFQYILKHWLLLYSAKWLFQILFIDIVWKTNYFKISNWKNTKLLVRDKEMVHSVESPAVDVFSLHPPFLTNSTVVPLSASSRSLVLSGGFVCVGRIGGSERGKT